MFCYTYFLLSLIGRTSSVFVCDFLSHLVFLSHIYSLLLFLDHACCPSSLLPSFLSICHMSSRAVSCKGHHSLEVQAQKNQSRGWWWQPAGGARDRPLGEISQGDEMNQLIRPTHIWRAGEGRLSFVEVKLRSVRIFEVQNLRILRQYEATNDRVLD